MNILFSFLILMGLLLSGYLAIWLIGKALEEIVLKLIGVDEEDDKDGLV